MKKGSPSNERGGKENLKGAKGKDKRPEPKKGRSPSDEDGDELITKLKGGPKKFKKATMFL